MASKTVVSPLNVNVPIVDIKSGKPTAQFMQQWGKQLQYNASGGGPTTPAQMSALLDLISSTEGNVLIRGSTQWGSTGFTLANLRDVNIGTPPAGYVLSYDVTTHKWLAAAPGPKTLITLTDVNITAPTDGQVVRWNAATSKWLASTISAGTLAGLTDVSIPSPTDGYVLTWKASDAKWESKPIPASGSTTLAGLTDVSIPSPTDGYVLTWKASDSKWESKPVPASGSATLAGLTDVSVPSPTNGQTLTWKASDSKWEAISPTVSAGRLSAALTSGDITGPNVMFDNTGSSITVDLGTAAPYASSRILDYLAVGTAAARPTPHIAAGAVCVYYATDTNQASLWTGSAWRDVP